MPGIPPERQSAAVSVLKDWPHICLGIIPCLNEAAAIGPLVRAVREHLPHVCVVDDGSLDGTAALAQQAGAHVICLSVTQGKGIALQKGWDYARQQGFRWALMLDGDGQHCPGDIPAFFETAEKVHAALVIGDRMATARQNMPRLRRWVNSWMSRRISKSAGMVLPDTQSGFRLLDLEALASLSIAAKHYEIESDLVLQMARSGLRIEFVPIRVIYAGERSKINPLTDSIRWLRWWTKSMCR